MNQNFEKWGWKENPFTLKIDPKLFTGYDHQVRAAMRHLNEKHKIALLTGPTGSGKTMMLKWIEMHMPHGTIYLTKPPQKPEEFVDIFLQIFPVGFWSKIFRVKPSLYSLPKYLNKKTEKNHLVFLIDEAHETNKDVLEWLRVLTDQIDSMSLVVAGLPNFENTLKSLETFDQRITTRISLNALEKDETKDLIRKRIENVGGSGTIPFSEAAIDRIYSRTGGFPREVIKMCNRLVNTALEKELDIIDEKDIEEHREIELPKVRVDEPKVTFSPKPPSEEQFRGLPYKQGKIVEVLSRKDWLTPTAISEELGYEKYKSKNHAIRSVNNILRRLMLDGFVQREARGKAFMYALTPKVKTLFVES